MKSSHKFGVATNASGVPISNASVTVYLAGTTTKPPIWSDEARTASLANPFSAASDGYYEFFGLPGIAYRIQVSAPGATTRDVDNIQPLVPVGQYAVRGLSGANNAGTPNTKYDFSADSVILRGSSDLIVVRRNTGTLTCDVGVAGPTANGRDQAGAFSASSWIHFYLIWNALAGGAEGTLATLASATAPPTGPVLPSDYTHWAYLGANYFSGGSALLATKVRGKWWFYNTLANAVSNGTATVETAIGLTTLVPPNAMQIALELFTGVNAGGAYGAVAYARVRHTSGADFVLAQYNSQAGYAYATNTGALVPNVGQNLYYLIDNANNNGNATVSIQGYAVPNGG